MTHIESRSTVYNFFSSYAAAHPDEQLDMIDWLTRTLLDWVDPRALAEFAHNLPTNADADFPKLRPMLY